MNQSPPLLPPAQVSTNRGGIGQGHYVITPANHFGSRLPEFAETVVKKLTTPRNGSAKAAMYLLEIEPGGGTVAPAGEGFENFLYTLDGGLTGPFGEDAPASSFAFLPQGGSFEISNSADIPARLLWVKRRYEPTAGHPAPEPVVGCANDMLPTPGSVPGVYRLEMLPVDASFDFAMSILSFDPGAVFPKVEIHDEEHVLYMLNGRGIYVLERENYEVQEDDFIYMGPYCPQYYYPTGLSQSAYLLYKDANRDGF
ncbi:(S)-ureidoglycine aminohydrolase [Paeniglutamicibacter kerguelensis]|uniref:(S)-ureidoglycine aminohydrolase n=1 Tax=Paeniglutamicibacter kerguelensis TaxID=254788 RepID=A0ABS4XIW0_9MICC|nr:(S)-ureidoglycine aminohydrolase [Paeniglutamicibacter kerguelensis]MBP2388410.1 (S)-ureidoglycine aminohydrolase [Paeniglutamicibacter kerguelensis]